MTNAREFELINMLNAYAEKIIYLTAENKRLTEFAAKYNGKRIELITENEALKKRIKELEKIATEYGDQKIAALLENEMLRERIKELQKEETIKDIREFELKSEIANLNDKLNAFAEEINYLKAEKEHLVEIATYCDKRCEAEVDKNKKLEERNRILEQKYCDATREADKLRYQNWVLNRTYEIKEDIEIYIKEMESV